MALAPSERHELKLKKIAACLSSIDMEMPTKKADPSCHPPICTQTYMHTFALAAALTHAQRLLARTNTHKLCSNPHTHSRASVSATVCLYIYPGVHRRRLSLDSISESHFSQLRLDLRHLHTATHCNTLQHTATHCNTLQNITTHCNILQHYVVNIDSSLSPAHFFEKVCRLV